MPVIQEAIHKIEATAGLKYLKIGLPLLAFLLIAVFYDTHLFHSMNSQEAMDASQLARNIADGKGYTTYFIRPFSMYLLRRHNLDPNASVDQARRTDPSQIKGPHPDIANPPMYPLVLSAFLKVCHFDYGVKKNAAFWSIGEHFLRYKPEFFIALMNQCIFLGVVALIFLLANRLFDSPTAWMSVALLFGADLFWKFSISGLSTMLLLLIFCGLLLCLVLLEEQARETEAPVPLLVLLSVIAGALVGVGGLTRYAFGFMVLPVIGFLLAFGGVRRFILSGAALAAFIVVLMPWVVRNYHVSGTPFGTAGYAVYEASALFPENQLERSVEPDFNRPRLLSFSYKFGSEFRKVVEQALPKICGSWVSAFFLVGLFLNFGNPGASRIRYFVLAGLALFVLVQAMGHTQISEDSPEINSENLLVLFGPLVLMFGVSFFFALLSQVELPFHELRYVVIGLFCFVACSPLLLNIFPPRVSTVAYPPYHPPSVQKIAAWMKPEELTMSDIPWAMAWYGQRPSIWLTQSVQPDFYSINDLQYKISLLYLTRVTLNKEFLSLWSTRGDPTWGNLIVDGIIRGVLNPSFPLRKTQAGWLPDQMVLTDMERWKNDEDTH